MLFFGVFLRETARPVAKSRTNLAQIQEKLPNGWTDWHQIWHTWGLGGHKSKSLGRLSNDWTDWHHIWYTSADSSGNGHMLNTIRPSTLGGGLLGGQQLKSQGEMSNGWSDWHQLWFTSVDSSGNGHRLKQLAPRYHRAAFWVVLWDQPFKRLKLWSNDWTDWESILHI